MIEKHSSTIRSSEEKPFEKEVEQIADQFSQIGNIFSNKDQYTKEIPSNLKREISSFQSKGSLSWFRK